MNAALDIPADGPYFAGHFPGRPILPGVAALALVVDALGRGPARRIAHARFRQTIAPGERLMLAAQRVGDDAMRASLTRDGVVVLQVELDYGAPDAPPRAPQEARTPIAAPALDVLLPHRAPMRFVTDVLAARDDGADCLACVPRDCALVTHRVAPALAVLEAAAQTAGVWEALGRHRAAGPAGPRMGYLVVLRDVALYRLDVPAGAPLSTSVRLDAVALPLTHYRAEVALDGAVVMRGTIATVLA